MREIRLWCEALNDTSSTWEVEASEAHHFQRVLRGKLGQEVVLVDGRGGEAPAKCILMEKKRVVFQRSGPFLKRERGRSIHLIGPLPKGRRFDQLMEKAQEMGCASYAPLSTEFSVREELSASMRERTRERLKEACKQSRCPHLMELKGELELSDLDLLGDVMVLDVHSPALEVGDLKGTQPLHLLFGPEAGWSDRERSCFDDLGWRRRGLSVNHLRMETAAALGLGMALHFGREGR